MHTNKKQGENPAFYEEGREGGCGASESELSELKPTGNFRRAKFLFFGHGVADKADNGGEDNAGCTAAGGLPRHAGEHTVC